MCITIIKKGKYNKFQISAFFLFDQYRLIN
uniref:Uncharacterized protein n=1 Tax=Rhizophora mucronata TaxID=61149 RepID=A0A2P2J7T1_RHIMU